MRALCCGVAVRKAGMKVGAGSAALRSITHPAFEGICAKSRAAPPQLYYKGFPTKVKDEIADGVSLLFS